MTMTNGFPTFTNEEIKEFFAKNKRTADVEITRIEWLYFEPNEAGYSNAYYVVNTNKGWYYFNWEKKSFDRMTRRFKSVEYYASIMKLKDKFVREMLETLGKSF